MEGDGRDALLARAAPRPPRSCAATGNRRCPRRPGRAATKSATCFFQFALERHGERQVRPVEAGRDRDRVAGEDLGLDVGAGRGIGRRGEPDDRHAGEMPAQSAERFVFRPERRAPLRDAMRLVDGDEAEVEIAERAQHRRRHQPLGRHVEHTHLARLHPAPRRDVLGAVGVGVDGRGRDAVERERRHLVAHECQQRRDDEREPAEHQRRKLIAQRLARAGRHDREDVAPGQHRRDRLVLAGSQLAIAEHLGEGRQHGATALVEANVGGSGRGGQGHDVRQDDTGVMAAVERRSREGRAAPPRFILCSRRTIKRAHRLRLARAATETMAAASGRAKISRIRQGGVR